MMIRICLTWLLTAFMLLPPGIASAAASAPEALVKNVTEEVLSILHEKKDAGPGNRQRAISIIETKIAPHFDFDRMTSLAVGLPWRQANAEQRKLLTGEFRTLLVRTYANALTAYTNQTVSFKPSPTSGNSGEVTVLSQINKPGGEPIPIGYSLARSGAEWKVFDVAIANISLVTNYRSSFAGEVQKGGVDGLIKSLQDKNRRNDQAAKT